MAEHEIKASHLFPEVEPLGKLFRLLHQLQHEVDALKVEVADLRHRFETE